jgi:hypothetical protein
VLSPASYGKRRGDIEHQSLSPLGHSRLAARKEMTQFGEKSGFRQPSVTGRLSQQALPRVSVTDGLVI